MLIHLEKGRASGIKKRKQVFLQLCKTHDLRIKHTVLRLDVLQTHTVVLSIKLIMDSDDIRLHPQISSNDLTLSVKLSETRDLRVRTNKTLLLGSIPLFNTIWIVLPKPCVN